MDIRIRLEGAGDGADRGKLDASDGNGFSEYPETESVKRGQGGARRVGKETRWAGCGKSPHGISLIGADIIIADAPLHADSEILVCLDLHDQGFNIDHGARDIQFIDHIGQRQIILLVGRDHQ